MYEVLSPYLQACYELYYPVNICNFRCNNMLHSPLGFPSWISCEIMGCFFSPAFLDIFTHRLLKAVFQYSHATTFSGNYLWAHHFFFNSWVTCGKSFNLRIRKSSSINIIGTASWGLTCEYLTNEFLLVFD